jgi:hypothetical protein
MDTLEVQEPPAGYWEGVADSLDLDEQQIQTLTMGFHTYQQKAKPIIAALHTTVNSIHAILEASEASDSMQMQAVGSAAGRGQQPVQPGVQGDGGVVEGSGNVLQPQCASSGQSSKSVPMQQPTDKDWPPRPHLWREAHQQQHQEHQIPHDIQQQQQQVDQGFQQQHQRLLLELLQQGTPMAWDADACSHWGNASTPKPWQQFGLNHGCLTIETAEVLEGYMTELMQHVMKLREMHRTVTWLFLNVLNHKQHVLSITGSWPWWSRPLTSECCS